MDMRELDHLRSQILLIIWHLGHVGPLLNRLAIEITIMFISNF
jgi:hypothetical protein